MQMRSSDPSAPAPAALCAADTTGRGASGAWCCGVQVPDKAGDTGIMHDNMYVHIYIHIIMTIMMILLIIMIVMIYYVSFLKICT